jgi:hypothetical protein
MSVAALVLGLVALLASWLGYIPGLWWLGLIIVAVAIAGIIISSIGIAKARKQCKSAGMAIAGLVLSIIGLLDAGFACVAGLYLTSFLNTFGA